MLMKPVKFVDAHIALVSLGYIAKLCNKHIAGSACRNVFSICAHMSRPRVVL